MQQQLKIAALGLLPLLAACAGSPAVMESSGATAPVTVRIPAGGFRMGDPSPGGVADEQPVHVVQIEAFELGAYEVTVGEYRRFVDATGYRTAAETNAAGKQGCAILDAGMAMPSYRADTSWRNPGYPQSDQHPVVCLSIADVEAYIAWLAQQTGKPWRLPTEAEWEYAARAGGTSTYPWGETESNACRYANGADTTPGPAGERWPMQLTCSDGTIYPAPVGQYAPNAWGLYDIVGNVWEWTADCYRTDYSEAPADGSAVIFSNCPKRSMRGGAWPYPASYLRVSNRGGSPVAIRANDRGFRLAL